MLTYSLPKETVRTNMLLYRNTKVKVHSLDQDIDFSDFNIGVFQGYTLAPY